MKSGLAIRLVGPISLETLKTEIDAASYTLRAHLNEKGIQASECEITIEMKEHGRFIFSYDPDNFPQRNNLPIITLPPSWYPPDGFGTDESAAEDE